MLVLRLWKVGVDYILCQSGFTELYPRKEQHLLMLPSLIDFVRWDIPAKFANWMILYGKV